MDSKVYGAILSLELPGYVPYKLYLTKGACSVPRLAAHVSGPWIDIQTLSTHKCYGNHKITLTFLLFNLWFLIRLRNQSPAVDPGLYASGLTAFATAAAMMELFSARA